MPKKPIPWDQHPAWYYEIPINISKRLIHTHSVFAPSGFAVIRTQVHRFFIICQETALAQVELMPPDERSPMLHIIAALTKHLTSRLYVFDNNMQLSYLPNPRHAAYYLHHVPDHLVRIMNWNPPAFATIAPTLLRDYANAIADYLTPEQLSIYLTQTKDRLGHQYFQSSYNPHAGTDIAPTTTHTTTLLEELIQSHS